MRDRTEIGILKKEIKNLKQGIEELRCKQAELEWKIITINFYSSLLYIEDIPISNIVKLLLDKDNLTVERCASLYKLVKKED